MADQDVAKYIHGIALHCYLDYMDSPASLDLLHKKYPDEFIFYSECSIIPRLYIGKNENNTHIISRSGGGGNSGGCGGVGVSRTLIIWM